MMNHPSIAHLETKYTSPVLSSQYCVSCGALALPGWYLCEGCCSAAMAQIPTTGGAAPPAAACAPQMIMSSGDYWSERSSSDPSSNASVAGYASFPSPSLYDSYSIYKNAMPQIAHESPAVPCSNCACCGKTLDANRAFASTCSMRCEWVYRWSCPQCGRYRASEPYHEQPYCSAGCASQSHQANWCPSCGVRQILNGLTHCSTACASRAHSNFPIRPRKKIAHLNSALRHDVMSEKERHSLLQPLRHVFADHSAVVVNVVKCNPNTLRRKQYLTYRASVEQMMSSTGRTTKYGFGGEGNEQRRFVPLTMSCAMGEAGNPFALAGATVECCDNKRCNACVCLRNGMSMVHLGALSHYCTADLELSLLHAISLKNPGSLGAVGVCRAVIGVPAFVKDPSHIVAGAENTHSTIITAADPKHEGTYVFRDDAIELQYIILFQ